MLVKRIIGIQTDRQCGQLVASWFNGDLLNVNWKNSFSLLLPMASLNFGDDKIKLWECKTFVYELITKWFHSVIVWLEIITNWYNWFNDVTNRLNSRVFHTVRLLDPSDTSRTPLKPFWAYYNRHTHHTLLRSKRWLAILF